MEIWVLLFLIIPPVVGISIYNFFINKEESYEKSICIDKEWQLIKQKHQEDFFNRVHGSIERNVKRQEYALKDPKNTLQGITIAFQKLLKL